MVSRKSRKSRSRKSRRGCAKKRVRQSFRAQHKESKDKKKQVPLRERNLESLQALARSHGIPFGGLTRTALVDKLIAYGY